MTQTATSSTLPDPARPIGWGVLGPGRIAHAFAADLAHVDDGELAAVGSRSRERAEEFASTYPHEDGAHPRAHGSYEDLVADDGVDAVYVASPHALHLEHVRLALAAGKHVLCEKPVALRTRDAAEMVRLATERGLFFMEAMWTACHPVVRAVVRAVRAGEVGTPRQLRAELGFRVDTGPDDRLLDPALGAGALLDMGIYPLTLAHLVLGEAEQLTASAVLTEQHIDLDVVVAGRYPGGALAAMSASMTSWSDQSGAIATDRGRIELEGPFHHPASATFVPFAAGSTNDESGTEPPRRLEPTGPVLGRGYGNEADEVARCLRAGLLESPLVPHAQTLAVMRQLDDVRRQCGIRYDGE